MTINPTNLTVTAAANTKLYDGTTSAAAHPTITAGSIQSGGALTATTGLLKGVVQGEDTGGNPTSLAPYYVPAGIALSPTKLLLRLGSGAF